MHVELRAAEFDPFVEVQRYQRAQPVLQGKHGAATVFIGSMRDFNDNAAVQQMALEHYPGMTERYLHELAQQALARWSLLDILILHRVGVVYPDQCIVVVAVWSVHRAAAYDANRFVMEELKSRAPFWKKETLDDDSHRWVEKNTPG